MVLTVDVDYQELIKKGHVAGIVSGTALDSKEKQILTAVVDHIEEYQPGQFYRRELRCVDAVVKQLGIKRIDMILVDGYADFGTDKVSLGASVYMKYHVPVIGIAKNFFKGCLVENTEVFRGESQKPLYVTCQGITHGKAKDIVRRMAGEFRVPYLVKQADQYARDWST